jgi:centriolar protein POC1
VAFSPDDGACVATGASDGTMRVLDARLSGGSALIQAHTVPSPASAPRRAAVHALSWHPGGALLLGACADAALRLWDVRVGALAFTCHGHAAESSERTHSASGALAAAFSPAGDFFASGGADAQLLVWRTRCDEPTAPPGGGPPQALRRSFVRPPSAAPRPPVPPARPATAPPRATVRRAPPPQSPSPPPQRSYLPSRTPPPPRPHAPSPPDDGDAGGPAGAPAAMPGAFASAALSDSFQAATAAAAEYAQRLAASGRAAPARAPSPRAASPRGEPAGGDVAAALSRISAQLDVLGSTVAMLDERLTLQEARTGRALQQGLL